MAHEKIVYLLVGPRAAGKTTYGKRLLEAQPELKGISRDEILVRLTGTEYVDPYGGAGEYFSRIMNRLVRLRLAAEKPVKLILDSWNGNKNNRIGIIHRLREYGATRVVALYFHTSIEDVDTWFWLKPGVAKMEMMKDNQNKGLVFYSKDAPRRDYNMFHDLAAGIDTDGFDEIIHINPHEPLIML